MSSKGIFAVAVLVMFLLLPAASFARELQVGVSPNRIDLGEIARGSDNYRSFSLVTRSPDEILVRLGALPANREIYNKPEYSGYKNISSDSDASKWVSFPANPVVILPANTSIPTEGGDISGWRSAGFIISVPEDAEPCYYAFHIKPVPEVGRTYENGVSIAAITMITVVFKAPGDCVRKGNILDIQEGESVDGRVRLDTYFQNTGTATIEATVSQIDVYDESNIKLGSSTSSFETLKPGKTTTFRSYFSPSIFKGGETYNVVSTVSWGTGSITKSVPVTIEFKKPTAKAISSESSGLKGYIFQINPIIWIILILIIAYIIYKRE